MEKILIYDKYDETYREVIDVKELKEYILKKIEELKKYRDKFDERNMLKDVIIKQNQIQVVQSFLKDLEVEDD